MARPKVAFIGAGGTSSSLGTDALDIIHYADNKTMLPAGEILDRVPEISRIADVPLGSGNDATEHPEHQPGRRFGWPTR